MVVKCKSFYVELWDMIPVQLLSSKEGNGGREQEERYKMAVRVDESLEVRV